MELETLELSTLTSQGDIYVDFFGLLINAFSTGVILGLFVILFIWVFKRPGRNYKSKLYE